MIKLVACGWLLETWIWIEYAGADRNDGVRKPDIELQSLIHSQLDIYQYIEVIFLKRDGVGIWNLIATMLDLLE